MAKYDLSIREEELKNKVARDWFSNYDTTQIIDNIDFVIAIEPNGNELFKETEYLLWAEAKKGNKQNIYDSVVQLIFTIGKGRINEKQRPPKYIGAFDAEKIAFVPYNAIMEVFSQTDFNWNVPPSNHSTKEFLQLKTMVRNVLEQSSKEDGQEAYKFDFVENRKELKSYISKNFKSDRGTNRGMRITRNSFVSVYNQWRKEVMPTIEMPWDIAKKHNILDADFFLADLMLGKDNEPIMDKLRVLLLKTNKYQLKKEINELGLFNKNEVGFRDNMVAYRTFWARYERPPKKEYWDKIVERRDLLVPQDIRERKGSFFTPAIWVEKSQEYLAEYFQDDDWQDKYYIWDCCAGTGNLLANLTNKHNIWASTLDLGDVQVMHERIKHMEQSNPNGSNLLDKHVFQFDFLNDDLQGDKVPEDLRRILKDPEERKKLVIYINPPYAEAGNKKNDSGNKEGVTIGNDTYNRYREILSKASNELFAQFFIRIYNEIPSCILAEFSTLKAIQAPNFMEFRKCFLAKLEKAFIVPADTFDNVDGQFPIGFFIWNTAIKETFKGIIAKKYEYINKEVLFKGEKFIYSYDRYTPISKWFFEILDPKGKIGHLSCRGGNDFQGSPTVSINSYLVTLKDRSIRRYRSTLNIDATNLIKSCVFLAVRHSIKPDWYNDRDQFVAPNMAWKDDKEFQNDCLAYTLFHGQNRITSTEGVNHWIPFSEKEVNAPMLFDSHFMSDFIAGKCKVNNAQLEIEYEKNESLIPSEPIQFSPEAQAVMDAGRELWYYYMHHKDNELYGKESINVNASYYDIRRYFQGVDEKGKMNNKSKDEKYMLLWDNIKKALEVLAKKIEPKVYLYGFLLDETTLPEDEPSEVVIPEKKLVKTIKTKAPHKSEQKTVVHYHINAENISLQTDGTINIGEINEK